MGTRADFYIGTGKNAEWLGSVAWDGYEWQESSTLIESKTEEEFRAAVTEISKERDDWTSPEDGWPWPWNTSSITDYAYYFQDGVASCKGRNDWPDMSHIKNVTFGKRSGLIVIG
jgi:hypothetical protein